MSPPPPLQESEAIRLIEGFESLPEEEKPQARASLQQYQTRQKEQGLPLFPTAEAEERQEQERVRGLFTNGLESVPYQPPGDSSDPNAEKALYANMELLKSRYADVPMEDLLDRYEDYRNDYALRKFGARKSVSDVEFYGLAKAEVQRQKLKEGAAIEGYQAYLHGQDFIPSLQGWQTKHLAERPEDQNDFTQGYWKAQGEYAPYQDMADRLLQRMAVHEKLTKGGVTEIADPDPRFRASAYEHEAEEIAGMSKGGRNKLYALVAAKAEAAGYDLKGFWTQMGHYFSKQTDRLDSTVLTTLGSMWDVMKDFPAAMANDMTEAEFDASDARLAKRHKLGEVQGEIMDLVGGVVDPVRPTLDWMNDTVETGLIQAPGAVLPFMAISAATGGWGGFAVFTLDYAEQNRRDLRQMGFEDAQATELGAIAAPVQAAAESLSNLFQLGRFTKLQSVLSRFNKPLGGGWAAALRYGQNSALNLGVEFSEEQLQDNFAVPMVQEIVGALREDVPEVDWSFYGNRAVEQTPQLLSVLTPMALLFGGVTTSAQVRLSKDVTKSINHLKAVGMSDSQALEIAALPNPEDRIQRARELWDAREGTPQSMEEAAQTVAKNLRGLSRNVDARLKDLERRGILPPMQHAETDRWQLTFADGSHASFGNHAEADAARWHWVEDQLGKVHQATRAALSQMERTSPVGREIAVEFKPTVLTTDSAIASGLTTAAHMQRRLQQSQAAGEIAETGTETYEATLAIDGAVSPGHTASLQILGSSSNQFKSDILRTTIKLYQGHHVLTLVEEKLEGDAKAILATPQGRAWMTERLRAYEAASGDRLLRIRDDSELETDDLVEAWSSLGQSYLVGRSKKGAAIGQGGSRKIFADVLSAGLGGALNAETQFFHSVWRRAAQLTQLKREGKLGTDLEAELSKQLGLDSTQASEGWLAEQEGGMASEAWQGRESYSLWAANSVVSKSTDTILSPSGHDTWAEVTSSLAKEAKKQTGHDLKIGSVRMLRGAHFSAHRGWGAEHILQEHGEEFRRASIEPGAFIQKVLHEGTELWHENGRYCLVKYGRPRGIAILELRKEGDHYSVVTGYMKQSPTWKPRGVLVWRGRAFSPAKSLTDKFAGTAQSTPEKSGSTSPREPLANQTNEDSLTTAESQPNESAANQASFSAPGIGEPIDKGRDMASQAQEDPSFAVRVGASLNSQKKEIPKTTDKMPLFEVRGSQSETIGAIVKWMRDNPTVQAPDGRTILIANPEKGSLENRAEHWIASYDRDDSWRRHGRNANSSKLGSIAAIPTTLAGAQVKAKAKSGKSVYLRRYADNLLHAVFVDEYNQVTEHGLVNGGVATQYTLDPKKGIEGAVVIQDWTAVAPAYSVNPVKGAESDRVSTPGRQPSDQQGDTSAPTAHSYLNAEGAIVKTPPNSGADVTTPSGETFSLTYRARQKAQDQLAQEAIESILHHEQSRETNSRGTPAGLHHNRSGGDAKTSTNAITASLLGGSQSTSPGWTGAEGGRGRAASERAFLTRKATPGADRGKPLGAGSEHRVYFRPGDSFVTKATRNGDYGQVFDQRGPLENYRFSLRPATPSEYLIRLGLTNKVFGDDIRVIGYEHTSEGPSIITRQPYLKGPHPQQSWVDDFLKLAGFQPMEERLYDSKTLTENKRPWYRERDGVVVVDAKRQNFILHQGKVIPVDLMIQMVSDDVLDKTRAANVK